MLIAMQIGPRVGSNVVGIGIIHIYTALRSKPDFTVT